MGDDEPIERKAKYWGLVLILVGLVVVTVILLRRFRW